MESIAAPYMPNEQCTYWLFVLYRCIALLWCKFWFIAGHYVIYVMIFLSLTPEQNHPSLSTSLKLIQQTP